MTEADRVLEYINECYPEAEEFFEFNTIGSYLGKGTPSFAVLAKDLL